MSIIVKVIVMILLVLSCVEKAWSIEVESIKEITNPKEGIAYGIPMWTPDGRVIASSDKGLEIMNVDGTNKRIITDKGPKDTGSVEDIENNSYSLSPDGTKIAFVVIPDVSTGDSYISIINIDGTGYKQLTFLNTDVSDGAPKWSFDGTKIVFHRIKRGRLGTLICIINSDGSNFRELTPSTDAFYKYPVFSPDGTKIACVRDFGRGDKQTLCIMNVDGTGLRDVAKGTGDWGMKWSADGKKIWCDAEIVDVTTGSVNHDIAEGIISSDWQMVCGVNEESGEGASDTEFIQIQLYITGLYGGNEIKITNDANTVYWPHNWSQDGKMILATKKPGIKMRPRYPLTLVVIKLR